LVSVNLNDKLLIQSVELNTRQYHNHAYMKTWQKVIVNEFNDSFIELLVYPKTSTWVTFQLKRKYKIFI
jgi:hypothetical protein